MIFTGDMSMEMDLKMTFYLQFDKMAFHPVSILFRDDFFFFNIYEYFTCIYACVAHACSALEGQKRVSSGTKSYRGL